MVLGGVFRLRVWLLLWPGGLPPRGFGLFDDPAQVEMGGFSLSELKCKDEVEMGGFTLSELKCKDEMGGKDEMGVRNEMGGFSLSELKCKDEMGGFSLSELKCKDEMCGMQG